MEIIRRLTPLMSAQTVDEIASSACRIIAELMGVEACSILVNDSSRPGLSMRAATHIRPEEWRDVSAPHHAGLMGEAYLSGKTVLLHNASDFKHRGLTPKDRYTQASCVITPIVFSSGRVEGVINVTGSLRRRSFGEGDAQTLEAISLMVAGAMENARRLLETSVMHDRLAEILDNLHLGVLALDSSLRITHSNHRFGDWVGKTPLTLAMRELRQVLDVQIFNVCHRLIREAAAGGGLHQERFEGQLGGAPVKLEITVSSVLHPCSADGAFLLMFEDIGQDEEIRRLREADSLKRSFIRIISHELRTPLTVLQGALPLLQSCACAGPGDKGVSPERIQQIQQLLKPNVLRMSATVNTILDVVEIENGKLELSLAPVDLNKTVAERVKYLSDRALSKQVEFDVELAPELAFINADLQRLRQTLYELMDNAIKFSEAGQTVRVRTLRSEGMGGVSIANSGQPIDPRRRQEVFEKFYQLDHELTRKTGGCGLGLYLVRNIAQLHGGSIEILDGGNNETVFLLRIPFLQG